MDSINRTKFKPNVLAVAMFSATALVGCFDGGETKTPGQKQAPVVQEPPVIQAEETVITVALLDENGNLISSLVNNASGNPVISAANEANARVFVKNADGSNVGGDAGRFVAVGGTAGTTEFSPSLGQVVLSLTNTSPTVEADDLDVIFVGYAPGYTRSSAKLVATASGTYRVEIKLVSTTPAETVNVVGESQTVDGAIKEENGNTVIEVPAGTNTETQPRTGTATIAAVKGGSKVTIPAKLTVKKAVNAAGETVPLAPGPVKLQVTHFENNPETDDDNFVPQNNALTVFPGGLDVTTEDDSGANSEGSFSSAGFVAVELTDSDGNLVSEFDTPLVVEMTIPVGTPFPPGSLLGTDQGVIGTVDAGDTVPVWSFDEVTGKWAAQKCPVDDAGNGIGTLNNCAGGANPGKQIIANVTDTNTTDGLLNISFETTHLSYFNLDYYGTRCTTENTTIANTIEADIFDASGEVSEIPYIFSAYQNGGGWQKTARNDYDQNRAQLIVFNAPNFPVTLEMRPMDGSGSIIESVTKANGDVLLADNKGRVAVPANLCELHGSDIKLTQNNPAENDTVSVGFELVQACQQDQSKTSPYPALSIVYETANNRNFFVVSTESTGKGNLSGLKPQTAYSYYAWSRSEGKYKLLREGFDSSQAAADGTLTEIVELIDCPVEEPETPPTTGGTGATGGSGNAGGGG